MQTRKRKREENKTENDQSIKIQKTIEFPNYSLNSIYNNFKQGDVVFGLYWPRALVIERLGLNGFTVTYAEALTRPTVSYIMENASKKEMKKLIPEQKQFAKFLQKHVDYLKRDGGKHFGATSEKDQKLDAAYRRACKLLLINRDTDRTYRAHFILNDLDWKRVCDNKQSGISVTGSELRAAYRDYRKNGPNQFIFFYNNDHSCRAPWNQKHLVRHWQYYDELRKLKQDKVNLDKENKSISKKKC